jgi:hypothetical protein
LAAATRPVGAELVLDVVAELVADYVRLRKSTQSGSPCQQVEEADVEVDPSVGTAVERADILLKSASRVDAQCEDHESPRRVPQPGGSEFVGPQALGIVEDVLEKRAVRGGRRRTR